MTLVKNVVLWPVELATGKMLSVGDTDDVDIENEQHKLLLQSAQIAVVVGIEPEPDFPENSEEPAPENRPVRRPRPARKGGNR